MANRPNEETTINAAAVWFKFSPQQLVSIGLALAGAVIAWVTINQNIADIARRLDGSSDYPGIVGRVGAVETDLKTQARQYDACLKELQELRSEVRNQSETWKLKSEDTNRSFEAILKSIESELKRRQPR